MKNLTAIPIQILDKSFSQFARTTVKQKKPNQAYVISQLQSFKKLYSKQGFFRDFLVRLEDFALSMENYGGLDIAGIIFAKLAKFPTTPEMKEQFLRGALRIARKQKDTIHTLARTVDLKKLYEANGKKKEAYRMLFSEEQILTFIVENYNKAAAAFKTVSKNPSPLKKYKYQLALTKLNITKEMKPNDAYPRLLEARDLFASIGCEDKVKFIDKLLNK